MIWELGHHPSQSGRMLEMMADTGLHVMGPLDALGGVSVADAMGGRGRFSESLSEELARWFLEAVTLYFSLSSGHKEMT